ncbi:putative T7SS-secreted protein [Streptomyces sp. NPDC005374]|uniref:putative T7SS-secreted protein n=1 Tax=Streptomyces sp. NPDC005374 TaxID=3364713 RepID=UPI003681BF86
MGFLDDLDGATQGLRDTFADGAQSVTHGTSELLDAVGAHGWADKADGAGSWVVDGLGARTRELELDETDDPALLVHGDAGRIRASAGQLRKLGAAFERTGLALRKMDPEDWHGQAADRFREKVRTHPGRWLKAADSFEGAATAMDHYAHTVEWARGQAREAVERWKQAQRQTEAARARYRREADDYAQQILALQVAGLSGGKDGQRPPQEPGPFHDPGAEGRDSAEHLLEAARRERDSEGARLAEKLARGTDQAPAEPEGLDRLKRELGNTLKNQLVGAEHKLGGVIKTGTGMLRLARTVNPLDPYNLTHPADYSTNLTGVARGLVHSANHPTELVKGIVGEGWSTDRNQAMGAFATNFVGGGGAVAKAGGRAAAHGMEGAVARDTAKTVGQDLAEDTAGAVKHVDDASEAAGKLDPDDPRSLPAAVEKNIDIDGMTHQPVWRESHEPLYRNDNRHPGEIFEQGFHPWDPSNNDLFGYVEGNHKSAFVGTTTDPDANWVKGYRYEIDAPGGIDVNQTLPNNKYADTDKEIAFAGGIDRKHIKGAWEISRDGTKGEWVPNPHYEPHVPRTPTPEPPPASRLPQGWTR